jgi:hypothetical protein
MTIDPRALYAGLEVGGGRGSRRSPATRSTATRSPATRRAEPLGLRPFDASEPVERLRRRSASDAIRRILGIGGHLSLGVPDPSPA